ncbi:response regulator [Geomonas subterranea]|uniref:Response regulator n=1 Tax=Geomonas subterranea TaxID=2847989 RepID=A0ABX8LGC4_9BACT|nr:MULTISPECIES: response regulator [Geomonas]QXE91027.1 response regulator [Geomonas subterranea]QXM10888.1 response regulator [Geomonas subterranea]
MRCNEKRETILLADDEPEIREVLRDLLICNGYTVITASNGQDALEKFIENTDAIELLVTDIVMPGRDGISSYNEMKKINPGIKVIYMTGFHERIPPSVDALRKPFHPSQLVQLVRSVLGNEPVDQ